MVGVKTILELCTLTVMNSCYSVNVYEYLILACYQPVYRVEAKISAMAADLHERTTQFQNLLMTAADFINASKVTKDKQ